MKPPNRSARPGFTLVEVLTVIAIVGVLAGILIPVVSRARSSARQSASVSNLRELHRALLLYAGDHRDQLPGPATVGITKYVRVPPAAGDSAHLGAYLAPYLGAPATSQRFALPILNCPSAPQEAQDDPWCASYIRLQLDDNPAAEDNVWGGYLNPGTFPVDDAVVRPKRINALSENSRRSSLIVTADRGNWVNSANVSLPDQGVVNGKRLHLFIDGQILLDARSRVNR